MSVSEMASQGKGGRHPLEVGSGPGSGWSPGGAPVMIATTSQGLDGLSISFENTSGELSLRRRG
jgi:hypothetical protein